MSGLLDKDGREHLVSFQLSVAEIKTLKMLRDHGEQHVVVEALKPLAQAVIREMVTKKLIELRPASELIATRREIMRLTDLGRRACTYLDSLERGPTKEIRV